MPAMEKIAYAPAPRVTGLRLCRHYADTCEQHLVEIGSIPLALWP